MGASVLGISVDSNWCHKAYADDIGVTFPLLTDRWGEVGKAFGVWNLEELREHRAVMVLDAERTVRYSRLYKDADVPDIDEVFNVLREISTGRRAA